ncbi:MAG TPA: PhzF family phenazine biosynthesis protein [Nocardioidaceae bacterium]|nr:PhzF family phenazine biosynthesis protein [Nocardioidaceae bacterium]
MRLRYDIVDVFTDRPFAGNQLAVVHGASQLTTEQCLALAREFGFSETTFPSAVEGRRYAVRIFTPGGEIPFAGHPTLGTAWVLRSHGLLDPEDDSAVQVCGAGEIAVRFLAGFDDPGDPGEPGDPSDSGGTVELAATPRDLSGPLPDDVVAEMLSDLGLGPDDVAGPVYLAGCGLTFVHLPVREDAVGRARVPGRPLSSYRLPGGLRDPVDAVNVVALSGRAPDLDVHARVFCPDLSVPEDPATGSAAAGLGVALVAGGVLPDGGSYRIRQGVEMGRPSLLRGRVTASDGVATRCEVAGGVRAVATGEIEVP